MCVCVCVLANMAENICRLPSAHRLQNQNYSLHWMGAFFSLGAPTINGPKGEVQERVAIGNPSAGAKTQIPLMILNLVHFISMFCFGIY